MNHHTPTLVIAYAAVFAFVIFILMQTAQPPFATSVECPPSAEPTPEEGPETESTTGAGDDFIIDLALPE